MLFLRYKDFPSSKSVWILCLMCACVGGIWGTTTSLVVGQDEDPKAEAKVALPVVAFSKVSTVVSVPDGGVVLIGNTRRFPDGRRITSKNVIAGPTEKGKRLHVNETRHPDGKIERQSTFRDQPAWVTEKPDGTIEVKWFQEYSKGDLKELETLHPELAMHLRAFPTQSNGDSDVRLTVNISTTIKAESLDELKEKSSFAFELYQAFTGQFKSELTITVTPRIIIQEEEEAVLIRK